MSSIQAIMQEHYSATFEKHGCTLQGVDWGDNVERGEIRYTKILELIDSSPFSILDVGCGYGELLNRIELSGSGSSNTEPHFAKLVSYTGIDLVQPMIDAAAAKYPKHTFIWGDFLSHEFTGTRFDYVACNGIFTQKLTAGIMDMDAASRAMIRKMFDLCDKGIVFNMMSSNVNFMAPNLFYKSPVETLAWVSSELSPHVRLDQSYRMFEYMVYVYR